MLAVPGHLQGGWALLQLHLKGFVAIASSGEDLDKRPVPAVALGRCKKNRTNLFPRRWVGRFVKRYFQIVVFLVATDMDMLRLDSLGLIVILQQEVQWGFATGHMI